jgi:hypothetical protein
MALTLTMPPLSNTVIKSSFEAECQLLRNWLGKQIEPGVSGQIGVIFNVQDGSIRSHELTVRQVRR